MNQATSHLTDTEIEAYVTQEFAKNPESQRLRLEAHLADCESCLGRVLHAERNRLGLLEGDGMKETPYPGCPPEETLQELAAGIAPPEAAEATTEHAAHCDFCGPRLNRYLKEFSEPLEAEDAAILKNLESSKPKWQKKFIRQHVADAEPRRKWLLFGGFLPRMVTAGALAAIAVVLFIYLRPDDLRQAQKLVASAYSERRTTEMRLTDVNFGEYKPLPTEMGAEPRHELDYQRPALLSAKSKLAAKLHSNATSDPHWLELEGRVALLENPGDAVEAERIFNSAKVAGLNDPDLQIDLAASFFEEDSKSDIQKQENPDRLHFARTIDLLNQVLKNPKLTTEQAAVAEFDLALAYEKTELWDLAASTWEKYISLDPGSNWKTEAQKHLDRIKKDHKILPPRPQGYKQPDYLLSHASDAGVQRDVEQFQEIALRSWLPTAVADNSSDAAKAVTEVAGLFRQQHSDKWWDDFLRATRTADLPAVRALSAALIDSDNDLSYQAMFKARSADEAFSRKSNVPGELLAKFTEIYALQRLLSGDICLHEANLLWQRLAKTDYHWLQGEVALERATCANLISDYEMSDINVDESRRIASQFHFDELLLRVAGIEASIKRLRGKPNEAWKKGIDGLRLYWQNSFSTARLYQFYSVMRQCAKDKDLLYASEALLRRSIAVIEADAPQDIGLRVLLYQRLANLLEQSQDGAAEAEAEAAKASELLQKIPLVEATAQTYPALTRIELAAFQLRHHQPQRALSTVEPVRSVLAAHADFMTLDYYKVLGNANLQLGQMDEAASAYRAGIRLADRSLSGLKDSVSRLAWIGATDGLYRGIVQVLLARKDDTRALAVWEESRSRFLADRKPDALDVESLIADNHSARTPLPPVTEPHLIFASFEDRLQIWTVRGSQVQSTSIAMKQPELLRLVREFAENCASPDRGPGKISQQSQELYSLLLKPVLGELPTDATIAVELDQPLADLTIEALAGSDGAYFGENYAVIRSPGILVEASLRRPLPLRSNDPFLVVDASPSSGNRYLPGHEMATETIASLYNAAQLVKRADVNAATIRERLGTSVAFHFTGHGIKAAIGAVLELSGQSFLTARDLSAQSAHRLRLAVLAACSSASSENGLLDTSNLVGALLSGKTPNIVASHWNVESQSTGQLMKSFYRHLVNEPAAQALRDARKDARRFHEHPYYWAGFSLIGRAS